MNINFLSFGIWLLSILSAVIILAQFISVISTKILLNHFANWMDQSNQRQYKKINILSDQLHLSLIAMNRENIFKKMTVNFFEKRLPLLLAHLSPIIPELNNPRSTNKNKMMVAETVWAINSLVKGDINRKILLQGHIVALGLLSFTIIAILGFSLSISKSNFEISLITWCQILWPVTITWSFIVMHGTLQKNIAHDWQQASNKCFQLMLSHMPPPLPILKKTNSPILVKEHVHEKNYN